jgi:Spy/CpxP family protein refolding chaperone
MKNLLRAAVGVAMLCGVFLFAQATSVASPPQPSAPAENCDPVKLRELARIVTEQRTQISALETERQRLEDERRRLNQIIERIRNEAGGREPRPTGKY